MIPSLQVPSYSQQQETTHSSPIMLFGSNEIYWTALWSHVPSSQMQSTFSHEKKTDQVLLWQRDTCTESTYMQNLSAAFQLFVSYFLKNKTTTAEKEKKKPSALSSWLYWCQLLTRQCRKGLRCSASVGNSITMRSCDLAWKNVAVSRLVFLKIGDGLFFP